MGIKKNYVLSTKVLLESPYSIYAFDEHNVLIVDASIEELSRWVDNSSEFGRNAREVLRMMDECRRDGNITDGVPLPMGGTLRVICNYDSTPIPISWDRNDAQVRVLRACKSIADNTILVTNDSVMRLRADILGIHTEPYKTEQMADPEKQYTGRGEITVYGDALDALYKEGSLCADDCFHGEFDPDWVENKYYILKDVADEKHTGLARYRDGKLLTLRDPNAWGIKPRNVGQRFALDALMAPADEIPLVILKGSAGTGKTILSCAAALHGVIETQEYDRCITTRANVVMDRELGYLKGGERQKVMPLLSGIADGLTLLTKNKGSKTKDGVYLPSSYAQKLYDDGLFVAQAMGYLRGRSLNQTFILVDECQNNTIHQTYSIVSRCGERSKLVLCGDTEQIDNPVLDARSNGLSYASEKMRGSPLTAQITFTSDECVRSPLAIEALKRMPPKGSCR